MKAINIMENNNKNKETFMLQYWKQRVAKDFMVGGSPSMFDIQYITVAGWPDYLELKPLSSITDEEIIDIANILMRGRDYDYYIYESELNMKVIKTYPKGQDGLGNWFGIYAIAPNNKDFTLEVWDYLRSRGYALSWMGFSVEKQIEYGWIKLTD